MAALVVTTLNSEGQLSSVASPTTKAATCLLAAFAALILLVQQRARPPAPALVVLLVVLVLVLSITSIARGVPTQRYLLLGQYVVITFSLLVWMSVRPRRVLGLLYTAGLIHLVLARVFPTEVPWYDGSTRLSGGSHPIQLGFEASVIIVVSIVAAAEVSSAPRRALYLTITAYAVYILLLAFARESLIAVSVAVVVLMAVIPGPWRWVRAYVALIGLVLVVLSLGPDGIASLLGEERASDLASATGRTDIWARILTFLPEFILFGFGYYALNDGVGPDRDVFFASNGEPAENALLQMLLDGGIFGAAVWSSIIVAAVFLILRSNGSSRAVGLASLPLFAATLLVSAGLSGTGIPWWYLVAVVVECSTAGGGRTIGDSEVEFAPVVDGARIVHRN